MWIPDGVLHDVLPVAVDSLKESSLLGHLLHDVLRREDGLEVEPLRLHLEPLVDGVLDADQLLLPLLDLLLEGLDEGRAAHRLRLDDVVVEKHLDVVDRRQDVHALQTQQTHATSQTQRHKHNVANT